MSSATLILCSWLAVSAATASVATASPDQQPPEPNAGQGVVSSVPRAYIPLPCSHTVSVINTVNQKIESSISEDFFYPVGVAVHDQYAYITNTCPDPSWVMLCGSGSDACGTHSTTDQRNTLAVINQAKASVEANVQVGPLPLSVAVSPLGDYAYVTSFGDGSKKQGRLTVVNTDTRVVEYEVTRVGGGPWGVAVNPVNGHIYVTTMNDGKMVVIEPGKKTPSRKVSVGSVPGAVAVTPDGEKVYVSNNGSGDISIIDLLDNYSVKNVNVGQCPFGIAADPKGAWMYALVSDQTTADCLPAKKGPWHRIPKRPDSQVGRIRKIDAKSGTLIPEPKIIGFAFNVAVTPDGEFLYVMMGDEVVSILDAADFTPVKEIPVFEFPIGTGIFITQR